MTHVDDVVQIQLPPNSQRLIDLRSLVVLRKNELSKILSAKLSAIHEAYEDFIITW